MARWRDNYATALRVGRVNYSTPGFNVSAEAVGVLAYNSYLALNIAYAHTPLEPTRVSHPSAAS